MADGIEERISVVGAEESKRKLDDVAGAQEKVASGAEDTGRKAQSASPMFDNLFASMSRWLGLGASLQALVAVFGQFVDYLREAVQLQQQLADKASGFSSSVSQVMLKLGIDELSAATVLTDLRRAGGLTTRSAELLGVSLNTEFAGLGTKLLAGQNMDTARSIAAYVGAAGFDDEASGALIDFLGATGALRSPEETRDVIAKLAQAGIQSQAKDIGAFATQSLRGGVSYLQAGVPLSDVLTIMGQTRAVEVNERLAATTMEQIFSLAVIGSSPKLSKQIDRIGRDEGLDPGSMGATDRLRILREMVAKIDTPEEQQQFYRMVGAPERAAATYAALQQANVDRTRTVNEAALAATERDFELVVLGSQNRMSIRAAKNEAARDFEEYVAGAETFTLAEARKMAASKVDQDIARGVRTGMRGREYEEERYVVELFKRARENLAAEGVDVSGIDEAIGALGGPVAAWPGLSGIPWIGEPLFGGFGYLDSRLRRVGSEIDEASRSALFRRLDRLNSGGDVTVIGTQYNDVDPLQEAQQPTDRND